MNYGELLKDPRWQRKRLEIMQRDEFTCLLCRCSNLTLHVHHQWYNKEAEGPWDYDERELITVCKPCHDWIHSASPADRHRVESLVLRVLFLKMRLDSRIIQDAIES